MQLLAVILAFSLLVPDSDALQCYQCSKLQTIGACDEKVTGSLVTCLNGVTACVIGESYTSTAPSLYMRGCTDLTNPAKPTGCTSTVLSGVTSKFCYCSADKCNENFGTAGASAVQFSLVAAILSAVLINQL